MIDADPFRAAVDAWVSLVERTHELPPPVRVEALTSHLAHLYATAVRLPPATPIEAAAEPAPWPESWPGLGPLDAGAPPVTLLLRGLTSDLTRGLAMPPDAAVSWWSHAFALRWGTLATAALTRLHGALREQRLGVEEEAPAEPDSPDEPATASDETPTEPTEPGTPKAPAPQASPEPASPASSPSPTLVSRHAPAVLPGLEPAPPTRSRTARARATSASSGSDGVLGLRFAPHPQGLQVQAVHPAGPAAGLLRTGDVLLSIDGLPLAGRDDDALRAALTGPAGVPRQFQVARGAGLDTIAVTPVLADELAAAPREVDLLVLDTDALAPLRQRLEEAGVRFEADPDQPALWHLHAPAESAPLVDRALEVGQAAGWWERLP